MDKVIMAPPLRPPPPPPLPGAVSMTGPPPPMPPQLQAMMRQMQQRQPKFQTQTQPPAPYQQHQGGRGGFHGGRGGRGRGRGRGRGGRGGFHNQQQNYRQNRQPQFKRKRGPSDDVRDATRFFLPSFLEDPWKELEAAIGLRYGEKDGAAEMQQHGERKEQLRPRRVQQYAMQDGPGRVFFQPSFLEDPWAQLVR